MMRITDKSLCCGCTACMSVCPHGAISMKEDGMGFLYPETDSGKCTECGLCLKVCDFSREREQAEIPGSIRVTAARLRDEDGLKGSQSGGMFTALSDIVLKRGGTVYGAGFRDDFSVAHQRAETAGERDRLRGSKYVQSDMGETFSSVKADLAAGKEVLFTGTPCQVAGLKSFLPERLHGRLTSVDFICHGVPSPKLWKEYLIYIARARKLKEVSFRDKDKGWKEHWESFATDRGKEYRQTWRLLFHKDIMLRECCLSCPYKGNERAADVTVGDFWGVEEAVPSMNDGRGVSMVIGSSDKGKDMLAEASEALLTEDVTLTGDFVLRKNPSLFISKAPDKDRRKFEQEYMAKGFVHVARRWSDLGWRYRAWLIKKRIQKITGKR